MSFQSNTCIHIAHGNPYVRLQCQLESLLFRVGSEVVLASFGKSKGATIPNSGAVNVPADSILTSHCRILHGWVRQCHATAAIRVQRHLAEQRSRDFMQARAWHAWLRYLRLKQALAAVRAARKVQISCFFGICPEIKLRYKYVGQ